MSRKTVQVFGVGQIAEIFEMPRSRVWDWITGKTLRIVPSVEYAQGRGTPNLFSRDDLYLFGIANMLFKAERGYKSIQGTLDGIKATLDQLSQERPRSLREFKVLVSTFKDGIWSHELWESVKPMTVKLYPVDTKEMVSYLNLRRVIADVDERIARFQESQTLPKARKMKTKEK